MINKELSLLLIEVAGSGWYVTAYVFFMVLMHIFLPSGCIPNDGSAIRFWVQKKTANNGGWLVVGSGWNAVGSQLDIFIYNSILPCQVLANKWDRKIFLRFFCCW